MLPKMTLCTGTMSVEHTETYTACWYYLMVGGYTLEDEERSGRPSELNLSELRRVVRTDPFQSTREMESTLCVHSFTIESELKKSVMKKKHGQYVPHHLEPVDRVDACLTLLNLHRENRWLEHLIISDKERIYYNNFHRRAQWVDPGETLKEVLKDVHPKK
ncbi:hypothetical protein TELCIR_13366, partial [Teladorsagia circumcincta]